MIFSIIFAILSVSIDALIIILTGIYSIWWADLLMVLALPIFYAAIFIVYLLILFIWSLFINKKKDYVNPNKFYYFILKQTCYLLVQFSNSKIYCTGLDKIPNDRKCLIVNNHTSNFDPICIMAALKQSPIICITKPENKKIPICGPFIHRNGFISIDRKSAMKALRSIMRAAKLVEEDKAHICISPEGTRSKTGELLPFKAGSFKTAYYSNSPIVVVSLLNTNKIAKDFPFKRTKVYLDVVDVIYPENYKEKTTIEISEIVRNEIQEQLNIRKGEKK